MKDKIWKAAKTKKKLKNKGTLKSFTADLANETLWARREWFKMVKKNKCLIKYPISICDQIVFASHPVVFRDYFWLFAHECPLTGDHM